MAPAAITNIAKATPPAQTSHRLGRLEGGGGGGAGNQAGGPTIGDRIRFAWGVLVGQSQDRDAMGSHRPEERCGNRIP